MSARSKYDAFWFSVLNELEEALERAYRFGREVIVNVSGIARYGERRPESWAGRVVVGPRGVEKLWGGAHMKSLARVLLSSGALRRYDVAFTLRMTRDLKLVVRAHGPPPLLCVCDRLFVGFHWTDLQSTDPSSIPDKPGVYVLRARRRGKDPREVYEEVCQLLSRTRWKALLDYAGERLSRLKRIGECPVLYIGSTPRGKLRGRFRDLAGKRHTAFFPVLALLLHGWQLDYGYLVTQTGGQAEVLEKELKRKYAEIHKRDPPLTRR